jgi:short-subunit dehydrogenase
MKKAIIIGATSGIGKELARVLVQKEYRVGITGRRTELLTALQLEHPKAFVTNAFDVTDCKATIESLEELLKELGGLDLLVISSGTGELNEALDFELEQRTIDTNVTGFTNITDWAMRFFLTQKSGHLAAISSIGGLRGSRQAPSYSATKAYQINYLEAMRQVVHHAGFPITVTDVRPGFVDTAMAKGEGLFWVVPVEKAARQLYSGIDRKKKVVYISKRWGLIAMIMKLLQ